MSASLNAPALLLTGAGFTKSFGGFLSDEMWADIFSRPEVQSCPAVRSAMLNELNYEVVYSEVLEKYPPDARKALVTATRNAYLHMHSVLCGHPGEQGPAHTVRYTELAPDRFKGFWTD